MDVDDEKWNIVDNTINRDTSFVTPPPQKKINNRISSSWEYKSMHARILIVPSVDSYGRDRGIEELHHLALRNLYK